MFQIFSYHRNVNNAVMRLYYFPRSWKLTTVVYILKAEKLPEHLSNYRPISFLPSLSKETEKFILKRLEEFSETNNFFPDFQYGFLRMHGCGHQLRLVVSANMNRAWHGSLVEI